MFGICANSIPDAGQKSKPNGKFKNCRKRFLAARSFACILVLFERKRGFYMKQSKAAILVLLAGALWGSMGLFVRKLNAAGLYAMDVV